LEQELAVGLCTVLEPPWGEQAIGAAAVGAMAEDEKFFGKGLLMTVIPESISNIWSCSSADIIVRIQPLSKLLWDLMQ